jgi:serine/threonine-protein kinase
MTLEPGRILDNKYRIVRLIGEGGMGSVHEGENTLIARRVAIKVLHAGAAANEQALTRFEREAQAAGRIGSDHILEVLDLGTLENGDRYMVMEYLDGEPLSDRIASRGKMVPAEIGKLMRQALKGLQAAHDAGIIHRDLKPDNLYILREKAGHQDFVKIIDFGISKFSALGSDMNMTRTGAVMGTPYYMSPEQAKGSAHVDPRSDVYAIGVIS